jgi:hypothetical protein
LALAVAVAEAAGIDGCSACALLRNLIREPLCGLGVVPFPAPLAVAAFPLRIFMGVAVTARALVRYP